jgi:LysR family nitrogen assimilation transcriptional regulator
MELRQLRFFIGVSDAGSLLKAAGRLHIAQPALGQQIASLEHELGVQLFARSSRGMALTESGKLFLTHARIVLADAERARLAVRESAASPCGEVSVGLPTTVAMVATLPILTACRSRLPGVRIKIVEAYSGFLREWLTAGRLDVALLYGGDPDVGLAKRALVDDQLVFVTSPSTRNVPKKMAVRDLSGWPLILPGREHGLRRMIEEACAPLSLTLNVVAEIESLTSVKQAAEAELGSTILPMGSVAEERMSGRLRVATIHGLGMSRRIVLAANVTRPQSVAVAAVSTLVVDILKGMAVSGAWPVRWIGDDRA